MFRTKCSWVFFPLVEIPKYALSRLRILKREMSLHVINSFTLRKSRDSVVFDERQNEGYTVDCCHKGSCKPGEMPPQLRALTLAQTRVQFLPLM